MKRKSKNSAAVAAFKRFWKNLTTTQGSSPASRPVLTLQREYNEDDYQKFLVWWHQQTKPAA